MGNIKTKKTVNPTEDMYEQARKLEDDPQMILNLIDMLFLGQGPDIPS